MTWFKSFLPLTRVYFMSIIITCQTHLGNGLNPVPTAPGQNPGGGCNWQSVRFEPGHFDSVLLGQKAIIKAQAATTISNRMPRPLTWPWNARSGIIFGVIFFLSSSYTTAMRRSCADGINFFRDPALSLRGGICARRGEWPGPAPRRSGR